MPFDDRRPYRRNLPPRILAKLKARSSTSASVAEDAAADTATATVAVSDASCNGAKDSNVEATHAKVDVGSGADSQQNDGKL